MSRRHLLGGGAATLGAAGIGWGTYTANAATRSDATFGAEIEPFHGLHQGGVTTSPQAHAVFVGLDLVAGADRSTVTSVLRLWTEDAARLTQGLPALADTEPELAVHPARLTATVGFGPNLFTIIGREHARPQSVRALPAFAVDRLEPAWSDGDLLLQVCADDPVAVAHAVRVLVKNVRSMATVRWTQRGFRSARGVHSSGTTMRNLMGQIDGTTNPAPHSPDFDALVWDTGEQLGWFSGGTTLVLRRIRIELDTWDELDRSGRELAVGRTLGNGAPLTGGAEHDEPDFTATRNGIPIIPENSHIALAHNRTDDERFLRRAYNYDDPPRTGESSNAGLIFASYQRDITTQFLPVQQRLADSDALNRWITPIGSAVFAIAPGVEPGDYLGRTLLEGTSG